MTDFVPFARPDLTEAELDAVRETLLSGWMTTGPKCRAFEAAFAEKVGAPHAVAVNSCTAAMHLALEAMGIGQGDEVIVPTLTFAATGEVVRYLGARPVLVEVREDDQLIDPAAIEAAVTKHTRAVIPVHFAGQPCDLDSILEIARAHDLWVLEDAAHAVPAEYRGRPVGNIGDVTAFSFYATKTLTTGEGGMATTANPQWAERMRMMRLHGISTDAWKRYTAAGSWYYEILAPGFKYNMTDIAAALGLVQLERAGSMLAARKRIAAQYTEALGDHAAFEILAVHPDRCHAWHLFVIRLRPQRLTLDRAQFIEALKARGVGASVHFIPLHLHRYYRETFGYAPDDFPIAKDVYERSVSLPIFSGMTPAEISKVIDVVRSVADDHRR